MFTTSIASALCLASLATAHFTVDYPEMRGDSFAEGASQYVYPCAGVNQTARTNRTLWPLDGGSVKLDLHHKWTYLFINLGIGAEYPSFNISLTPSLLNQTGNGTLCIPKVPLPANIKPTNGQQASVQIVTGGANGVALYNCADITFSSNATTLSGDACVNSPGVAVAVVTANGTAPSSTTNTTNPASETTKSNGVLHSSSMMTTGVFAGLGAIVIMLNRFSDFESRLKYIRASRDAPIGHFFLTSMESFCKYMLQKLFYFSQRRLVPLQLQQPQIRTSLNYIDLFHNMKPIGPENMQLKRLHARFAIELEVDKLGQARGLALAILEVSRVKPMSVGDRKLKKSDKLSLPLVRKLSLARAEKAVVEKIEEKTHEDDELHATDGTEAMGGEKVVKEDFSKREHIWAAKIAEHACRKKVKLKDLESARQMVGTLSRPLL
ncbi:hypothetical protein VTL71DRAFT_5653 [Oculimacula yallundae]|uniref:Copper acquisition factor BIM1-like domain-containing protein n=1 Tax=Oculimacula yallundae TaxID=86028 RepID=A0ABR4BZN1_9HELO